MTTLRCIFIALTAAGAVMAFFQPDDSSYDTLPFPGTGLSVRMQAKVKSPGEHHLIVGMPVTNIGMPLQEDTQTCSLAVKISKDFNGPIVATGLVTSISLGYEFGFAKVQYYSGGSWYLKPGTYDIDIQSQKACPAAMSRGATISVEEQIQKPTETFLWSSLKHECGILFFWTGLIGLLVCEIKKSHGHPLHAEKPGE